jgi:Tfp pilus assembly protein PilN
MKAVNLIPRDARRGGVTPSLGRLGASHLLIGLLVVAAAMVTLYVLSNNTVTQRKAQLSNLNAQMASMQAAVARLQKYDQFEKLAQAREATVKEIASSRFDWHGALSDLSKVVPHNTILQSLVATVSTNSSTGGAGGGSGAVRADIEAPAFTLKGCTGSQDEVAQVMSRLRLVNGVSRVTLEDSSDAASGSTTGCTGPTFDMVVFFQPLTGNAATLAGVTTATPATPASTTSTTSTTPASTTTTTSGGTP